jgi:hypothetical protein
VLRRKRVEKIMNKLMRCYQILESTVIKQMKVCDVGVQAA